MRVRGRNLCLFCDQQANTDEDVWPLWLVREIGQVKIVARLSGRQGRNQRAENLRIKSKLVCSRCNNEWMSGIESAVIPHLRPMLRAERVELDEAGRLALARWALKTAMVFEHTMGLAEGAAFWRQGERIAFAVPPHQPSGPVDVFVGTYYGSKVAVFSPGLRHAVRFARPSEPIAPSTTAVIVCRQVLLCVMADRYKEATGRDALIWPPPHFDRLKSLIVPGVDPLVWPLDRRFGDTELAEFQDYAWPGRA